MKEVKVSLPNAIRGGAKLRPQGFFGYFTPNAAGQICSCAYGAAYEFLHPAQIAEALLVNNPVQVLVGDRELLFEHQNHKVICQICSKEFWLSEVVIHLNDFHELPREAIADVLEKEYGL